MVTQDGLQGLEVGPPTPRPVSPHLMTFAVLDAQSLPADVGATLILRETGVHHIRTTGLLPEPCRPYGRGPDIIYRLKTRSSLFCY